MFLSETPISLFKTAKTLQLVYTTAVLNIKVVTAEVFRLTPEPGFQIPPICGARQGHSLTEHARS